MTLTATQGGSSSDYPLSATNSYDTTDFSRASFTPGASGSDLNGGSNSISNAAMLYSFNVTSYAPDGNMLDVADNVNGHGPISEILTSFQMIFPN